MLRRRRPAFDVHLPFPLELLVHDNTVCPNAQVLITGMDTMPLDTTKEIIYPSQLYQFYHSRPARTSRTGVVVSHHGQSRFL